MQKVLASDSDIDEDDYLYNEIGNDVKALSGRVIEEGSEAILFLQKKTLSLQQKRDLLSAYSSIRGPCKYIARQNFSLLLRYPETRNDISLTIQNALKHVYRNPSYSREFSKKAARKSTFTNPSKDSFFGFRIKCPSPPKKLTPVFYSNCDSMHYRKLSEIENCTFQAIYAEGEDFFKGENTEVDYRDSLNFFSPFSAYEEAAILKEASPRGAATEFLQCQKGSTSSVCKQLFEIAPGEGPFAGTAVKTVIEKHIEKREQKLLGWKKTIFPLLF